jgi:two-component system cell cycle response regulator
MSSDPKRDLAVLRQLTERLSDGRPLEDALHEVTDAALQLLPCDHASIRLFDASRLTLLAGARSGRGAEQRSLSLARGQGVAGWVMEHGLPAHVRDSRTDPRFVVAVGQGFSVRALIAEPLLAAGKPIGVLGASSPEAQVFSDDDVLLARILANCSVPTIERSRLERLSAVDQTTLAFNRPYLLPRMQEEMDRARHAGSTLSILVMDLDRMGQVNDSFGRDMGDRVLGIFSERVRAQTRRYDVLVRSGDDEFVLLMPTTSPTQALATAEKLRKAVGDEAMEPRPGGYLSQRVSIGVATWDGRESAEELCVRAAAAMHEAKKRGGDAAARAVPPSASSL